MLAEMETNQGWTEANHKKMDAKIDVKKERSGVL
jgi:hypothetical protein